MNKLLPHNKKAYEAVMAAFEGGQQRAAVVHATGTGKSYVSAAVASRFDYVLVIAPREIILDEVRSACKALDCQSTVIYATYASLLFNDHGLKDFDLIVLDEFHHTGAREWGRSVTEMLADNPEAKVLGTSATPVRYSDKHRNMADALFDGNVVSHLPLEDAIGTILPVPTYVRSIYDFDKTEQIILESITNARRTDEWKHESEVLVRRQCLDWKQSKGVPQILQKYLKPSMRHIILFAPSVNEGVRMRLMMSSWMRAAGFHDFAFYEINCMVPSVGKVIEEYKQDDGHTMRIAIAINMLNEGVHIEGVDCIIMLRNTRSQTIIEQQLGRCLTVSSKTEPLILDFVNNISLVYACRKVRKKNVMEAAEEDEEEENPMFDSESKVRYEKPKLPFKVIDECTELDELIRNTRHNSTGYTIEELIEISSKYKTRSEWINSPDNKYYSYAKYHGILFEASPHMGPVQQRRGKITYEECMAEAHKYNSKNEFVKGAPSYYFSARNNNWSLDDVFPCKRHSYTLEECKEMCTKYLTVKELRADNTSLYNYMVRHKLIHIVYPDHKKTFTKTQLRQIAKKYKTQAEFAKKDKRAYYIASKNGWLKDIMPHSIRIYTKDVTYEVFVNTVSKCTSRTQMSKDYGVIYRKALDNGWLTPDILPPHPKRK